MGDVAKADRSKLFTEWTPFCLGIRVIKVWFSSLARCAERSPKHTPTHLS
jgi:hypothetical protein